MQSRTVLKKCEIYLQTEERHFEQLYNWRQNRNNDEKIFVGIMKIAQSFGY